MFWRVRGFLFSVLSGSHLLFSSYDVGWFSLAFCHCHNSCLASRVLEGLSPTQSLVVGTKTSRTMRVKAIMTMILTVLLFPLPHQ